jgi:hypothetical protein
MTMHDKKASSARRSETDGHTQADISRRNALISIGKYAAYVTPAMTVLIRGEAALANHPCNSGQDGQGNAHSCM